MKTAFSPAFAKAIREMGLYSPQLDSESPERFFLMKPLGVEGNGIEGYVDYPFSSVIYGGGKVIIEDDSHPSDAQMLRVVFRDGSYSISVWNWVPGPGPGDFNEKFSTEEEVLIHNALGVFFNSGNAHRVP